MKKNSCIYIFAVLVTFLSSFCLTEKVVAEESAAGILQQCITKINTAPSVDFDFTIDGADGPLKGSMTVEKANFVMDTPLLAVWYDGRTQSTYVKSTQELCITEPSTVELMECNPFVILSNYAENYKVRRLPSQGNVHKVELSPHNAGTMMVKRAVVAINAKSSFPESIDIFFDSGSRLRAVVNKVSVGTAKPAAMFKFDKSKYSPKEVIDLR